MVAFYNISGLEDASNDAGYIIDLYTAAGGGGYAPLPNLSGDQCNQEKGYLWKLDIFDDFLFPSGTCLRYGYTQEKLSTTASPYTPEKTGIQLLGERTLISTIQVYFYFCPLTGSAILGKWQLC